MEDMRALALGAVGELPEIGEVPVPRPGKREVLVRISAAGVNYADTLMRRGFYLQTPAFPVIYLTAFAEYTVAPEMAPVIGGVYPLEKGAEALLALESRRTIGNLLLKP